MASAELRRIYLFSDTYGRSKSPFDQDDADALIATDFRSFPLEEKKREFDIYGREKVAAHMLRLVFHLHGEVEKSPYLSKAQKEEFQRTLTGVFINAAPRLDTGEPPPFYVATGGNVRVVTTDLQALSPVKGNIESLAHLPAVNPLYGDIEQFRSSYTPFLLAPDNGLALTEDPIALIPDFPDDRWELAYVDRFGNMVTYSKHPEEHIAEAEKSRDENGGYVKMIVGNVSQRVNLSASLKSAEPGMLVMYQNGDIEVVRKWEEDEDRYTRLYQSAYFRFAKPDIGAKVRIR